jgi:tRNA/tmRNA/rRNA uracil-C5-methylase (TrmA/RlmC/RlmD family)
LLLDPPRIGCDDKVLEMIDKIKPKTILLISCSPENFAVDISKLVKLSYEVRKIIPFDMFPQTHHVEVVGLLDLNHV